MTVTTWREFRNGNYVCAQDDSTDGEPDKFRLAIKNGRFCLRFVTGFLSYIHYLTSAELRALADELDKMPMGGEWK